MSKTGKSLNKIWSGIFWIAVLVVVVYLIARNVGVFGNVVVVLLGFGAVVLVHEFGHFIVAKLSGIRVEAFSIFMPPTLLGVRKTQSGFKFRVLPSFSSEKGEEPSGEAEDTEYRVGLFPFGGYVKLLGQEDTGPVKVVDDPRSFAKKPVSVRIAVITAGVTFNIISAVIIFMIVFLLGIQLQPPVVGQVVADSPAAQAGLKPGDEFVEIAGRREDLDFSNIQVAAALSDVNEAVPVTVRHPDGSEDALTLVATDLPGSDLREFGIIPPLSLKMARVAEPNVLYERTGLLPGDRISAVEGKEVEHYWDLAEIIGQTLSTRIAVTADRLKIDGGVESIETELSVDWASAEGAEVDSDAGLSHIYSIVPRLRVTVVGDEPGVSRKAEGQRDDTSQLKTGDIIIALGNIENPTYKEMRDVTREYENRSLTAKVLRTDANGVAQTMTVTVKPRKPAGSDRVVIGIGVALDAAHPVAAKTISTPTGPAKLEIPRGARILTVNSRPVSSFYDIIDEVRRWNGQPVVLEYRLDGEAAGGVTLQTAQVREPIRVRPTLDQILPFERLERLYQAKGPFDAIGMGYRRTVTFVSLTYITLKQLIGGLISPKTLMGPVGIMTLSYRLVSEQPLVYYVYFLGLISATIAVINFLPIPPFDGGLVVLMLIEKIKGSALSERAQGMVAYAGWALVLVLLVYVTFNDIVRSFFS